MTKPIKSLALNNRLAKAGIGRYLASTLWVITVNLLLAVFGETLAKELGEGLLTHKKEVAVPLVAKPSYRRPYKDPAFGTKIIKITDSEFGSVAKPLYSTVQAWNADESYLIIYKTASEKKGHYLLDGHTYKEIKKLDIAPSDYENVFWSYQDPDTFFFVNKYSPVGIGRFFRYNVKTHTKILIKDLSEFCDGNLAISGRGVQMQSLDDDLFGFRCRDTEQTKYKKKYRMLTYRISTGEVITAPLGDETSWRNWTAPSIAPSGKRISFQGTSLSLDLKTVQHRLDMAKINEHSNVGRTHDGQDALYQVVFDGAPNGCNGDKDDGVGHVTEYNLETGRCRSMINKSQGYPYTTSATHVSAQAYQRPGWLALSSVGHQKQIDLMKQGKKVPTLTSEIYLINTDPDQQAVYRLAHHRSTGKLAVNGGYKSYFGEPHVTISPSGTRLLFGSDWYDSGSVDTYVIELPGYRDYIKGLESR